MSRNVDHRFRKAWDSVSGRIIDIRNLPKSRNGRNCECTCVDCNKQLQACQGFVRAWYFRHQSKTECNGGPMTAIHLLAQQLLMGDHTIKTRYGLISYTEAVTEVPLTDSKFRADVLGKRSDGHNIIIEICVTHQLSTEKHLFLRQNKIHSIEIDLSQVDPEINDEELLEMLLNDTSKQSIIYLPEMDTQQIVTSEISKPASILRRPWYEDFLPWLFLISVIGFIYYVVTGRKQKSRKVWRKYK